MDVSKASAVLIGQFGRIGAGTAVVAFGVFAVPAIGAIARTRFFA
jgi:hypothetical protein